MPKTDYPQLMPLWIAVFIDILGFTILIPFLPFFSQEYGAPPWQIGLLLSTNALFGFVSGPIWGALSDARGRKPMLLISQVGTLIAFLMLAFSNNLTMLFISRVVDGIHRRGCGHPQGPQQRDEQHRGRSRALIADRAGPWGSSIPVGDHRTWAFFGRPDLHNHRLDHPIPEGVQSSRQALTLPTGFGP